VELAHADEQDLMKAIAEADPSALAVLHDRHAPVVYALCLRILRDAQEAEEALEDVFLQLWQRAALYDPGRGSVIAYLVILARSRAGERLRRRVRRERLLRAVPDESIEEEIAAVESSSVTPLHAALAGERRVRVRAALDELPACQRVSLELAFLDGLTHPEIAERLGEPLGTVKTRIRTGLRRLREPLLALIDGERR
jgi:RNA polymerase sigma-70 factor (ECF subfamily)